jgi:hypothetical protein
VSVVVGKWVLVPLSIVLVLISWGAAGLLTTTGFIASDLCVSPRTVSDRQTMYLSSTL